MISMTGYGKASISNNEYEIEIEIKSVNGKFLDLKLHLPKEMSVLELPIRSLISQYYKRGTIELKLRYTDNSEPDIKFNEQKLIALSKTLHKVANILSVKMIPIEYILNQYEIIDLESSLFEREEFKQDVLETIKQAIENEQNMAREEGQGILEVINHSLQVIFTAVKEIEGTIPSFRLELFEKMKERVYEVLPEASKQNLEQRLMQELALYLDKYDIGEELNRLKEHIDTVHRQVIAKEENDLGKTLNFIFQEMQREANTLGSKYSNYHSFGNILLIKEEIENCREIVQNVM